MLFSTIAFDALPPGGVLNEGVYSAIGIIQVDGEQDNVLFESDTAIEKSKDYLLLVLGSSLSGVSSELFQIPFTSKTADSSILANELCFFHASTMIGPVDVYFSANEKESLTSLIPLFANQAMNAGIGESSMLVPLSSPYGQIVIIEHNSRRILALSEAFREPNMFGSACAILVDAETVTFPGRVEFIPTNSEPRVVHSLLPYKPTFLPPTAEKLESEIALHIGMLLI